MGRVSVPPYWTPDGALVFVRLLSCVLLFAAPWTAALQASLSFTISQSLHKRMSIELVMPSNHLILCHPLLLPSVFPSIRVFASGGQSIGASTSASVLPMNIQGWFSSGLTGLISLLSKGLWRVFTNTTIQKHQFFGPQPSLWSNLHICTCQQSDVSDFYYAVYVLHSFFCLFSK